MRYVKHRGWIKMIIENTQEDKGGEIKQKRILVAK